MSKFKRVWLFLIIVGIISVFTYSWTTGLSFFWDPGNIESAACEGTEIESNLFDPPDYEESWLQPDSSPKPGEGIFEKIHSFLTGDSGSKGRFLNIIVHLLTCILIFLLFEDLTGRRQFALLISIIFSVHPAHFEAVVNPASLLTIFTSCLVVLGIYFKRLFNRKASNRIYYLAVTLSAFLITLLLNGYGVLMLLFIAAMDYCYRPDRMKEIKKINALSYAIMILSTLIYSYFTLKDVFTNIELKQLINNSFITLLSFFDSFTTSVIRLFYPINPDPLIIRSWSFTILSLSPIFGIALLLIFFFGFTRTSKKYPVISLSFFAGLTVVFPAIFFMLNELPGNKGFFISDRGLYLQVLLPALMFGFITYEFAFTRAKNIIKDKNIYRHIYNILITLTLLFIVVTMFSFKQWNGRRTFYLNELKSNPEHEFLYYNLALDYYRDNRLGQALQLLDWAESMPCEKSQKSEILRGIILHKNGLHADSIRILNNCLSSKEIHDSAAYNLAVIYINLEAYDEAEKFIKITGDDYIQAKALRQLARYICCRKQGQMERSNILINKMMLDFPEDILCNLALAETYAADGEKDKSEALFQQLTDLNGNCRIVVYRYAWRMANTFQEYDKAVKILRKYLNDDINDFESLELLITAYKGKGDYKKAVNVINLLLKYQLNPETIKSLNMKKREMDEKIRKNTK